MMEKTCEECGSEMELVAHISLVDCPGHQKLTSTMWSGTCIMDYTILVESVTNPSIPAPQTWEHMVATQIAGIDNAVVCLNKVDIIGSRSSSRKKIEAKVEELRSFVAEYDTDKVVLPTSAVFGINMDVLCEYIANLKVKEKDLKAFPKLIGIRSFDINAPKRLSKGVELKGGTIGGSLVQGMLNVGDTVLIYPGHVEAYEEKEERVKNSSGDKVTVTYKNWRYYPIESNVLSIHSETETLDKAIPGGLVGIQLDIDPGLTRNDKLVGNILVLKGAEHKMRVTSKVVLTISDVFPVFGSDEERPIKLGGGDLINVHINADEVSGTIRKYRSSTKEITLFLDKPVALSEDAKIVLSEHGSGNIIARCDVLDFVECECM